MGAEVIGEPPLWGTWEELLLGGAILRHGTRDWNLVAAELRARTVCPYTFTPEICKARYEDVQQRYSGCKAWFEELRKQRMEELKRALELSDNSIGSLESRLESLKAETERGGDCHVDNYSSQTESPATCQKSRAVLSSSKETSKDGLSAGSFTRGTLTNWSPKSQVPAAVPEEEIDVKPDVSQLFELGKVSGVEKLVFCGVQGGTLRRKRGKRKRKYCSKDFKEGSVGESDFLSAADTTTASQCKENSTSESGQIARSTAVDDHSGSSRKDSIDDVKGIFESFALNQSAFVFRRRLDSQKRGRYKKMILKHMDFDTIRSRISSHTITSAKELFRDLLLLANNGVVFYSKNTREYKTAFSLRALVMKTMQQHFKDNSDSDKPTTSTPPTSRLPLHKPPVKPRSARPGNRKPALKVAVLASLVDKAGRSRKKGNADSPPSEESLAMTKKGLNRTKKARRGNTSQQQEGETPVRGRKRIRAR